MKKLLARLIAGGGAFLGISLLSFTIFSIDISDWFARSSDSGVRETASREPTGSEISGEGAYRDVLRIMSERLGLPTCAYTEHFDITVEKTIVTRFTEHWQTQHDLLAAARATLHPNQHFSDPESGSTLALLRYEDRGKRVDLHFAHRRLEESMIYDSGRSCSPATHEEQMAPGQIFDITCDNARQRLSEAIAETVAQQSPERFWTRYRYTLDYQNLKIDFAATVCTQKEF